MFTPNFANSSLSRNLRLLPHSSCVNMITHLLKMLLLFILLGVYPKRKLLDHTVILLSIFWGTSILFFTAAAAKSLQSCLTLCNPINGSPPGSPIPVILQARTLEWVAISFSNAWKWKVKGKSLSHVWPLAWTAAYQAPPSMGFSRQEYWSGVPKNTMSFK